LDYFPIGGTARSFLVCVVLLVYVDLLSQVGLNAYRMITGSATCSTGWNCVIEYLIDVITVLCSLFLCAITIALRHRARSDRSIGGRCVAEEDVCLTVCCLPCSLMQLGREVEAGPEIVYCELPRGDTRPAPAQPAGGLALDI
jgi:hypothetical protein